ncbi:MAG: exodeoxyribonuclease VII large subunit [Gammaproteobacteria bacterium]
MGTQDYRQSSATRDIYTVSRLNGEVRSLLENQYSSVWIEGELSNLARPASGHIYFSLKDDAAQIRCAMFRGRNARIKFTPVDGMAVVCRGRVGLYEARGEYQLVVEHMEEAGEGMLQREFERLKKQLAAEGLFDSETKKPLPLLPRRLGVITSPTGAAVRDIIHILARRFPAVPVLVYPVPVQGDGAAEQIAQAIRLAATRAECDVLILARGGGSLEDLWSFNEEVVARAIHGCEIPVVSGIGHETDFTIADFVADVRAPTPSGAAELAVPDKLVWLKSINDSWTRIRRGMQRKLTGFRDRTDWLTKRVAQLHPGNRLQQQAQRLDELEQRISLACKSGLQTRIVALETLQHRLLAHSPTTAIREGRQQSINALQRLRAQMQRTLETTRQRLDSTARALTAVGPDATLERGYAIVTQTGGNIVRDARKIESGERLDVRVAQGSFSAVVAEETEPQD